MKELFTPLELNKILSVISGFSHSEYGKKEIVNNFQIFDDYEKLKEEYEKAVEFFELFKFDGGIDIRGIPYIVNEIEKLKSSNKLENLEYLNLARFFETIKRIKIDYKGILEKYPKVKSLIEKLEINSQIMGKIFKTIDANGNIYDTASEKLLSIRTQIKEYEKRLTQITNKLISKYSKYLSVDKPVYKSGRYCLAVKSEFKKMVKGFLVSRSESGITLFIEPLEIHEINEKIVDLKSQERIEISRILNEIHMLCIKNISSFEKDVELIKIIDSFIARARYAIYMNYNFVLPDNKKRVFIEDLRHPLIPKEKVVPVKVKLPEDKKGMVISGPNTGGKTVTLKAIGLFALFSKSAFPVPSSKGEIFFFEKIFVDIGDEQDIIQNLSTFSAHAQKLKHILKNTDNKSLVLIDELGAGTDPIEGSALALSIIEELINKGSTFFISSHLSSVKMYSVERDEILAASMGFDKNSLSPTYNLLIGVPGGSHAIEIAEKIGIDKKVIEKSKELIKNMGFEDFKIIDKINEMYLDLVKEREQAERKKEEFIKKSEELNEKLEILKRKELEKLDREIYLYKQELKRIKKELEENIRKIKMEKNENTLKNLLNKIASEEKNLKSLEEKIFDSQEKGSNDRFELGEIVLIKDLEKGKIIKLKNKKATVQLLNSPLQIEVNLSDLTKVEKTNIKEKNVYVYSPKKVFSPEIDIRGLTVEEAKEIIDKFLDDLVMSNYDGGYIIHGKGTGKLAMGIWKFLREDKRVKSFRIGKPSEGGTGVTYVEV